MGFHGNRISHFTRQGKPVIFRALACADVLLTLDRRDFRDLLGQTIYGLRVLTPGDFLRIVRNDLLRTGR